MKVERKRHIAKTISYRLISTLIGFGLMWLISGSIINQYNIISMKEYGIVG
jgi:uncharacterized membrane protein